MLRGRAPRGVTGELSPASVYVSLLPVVEACVVVAVPGRVGEVFFWTNCCSKSGFVATLIRTEFRSHMLTEEALVANCHAKNTRQ